MPRTRSSVSIGRPWNVSASVVDDMVHGRSLRFEARTVQCGSCETSLDYRSSWRIGTDDDSL